MHPSDEILTSYRDTELPETHRRQVSAHLAGCPTCAARLSQIRLQAQRLAVLAPPAGLRVSAYHALQTFPIQRKANFMKRLIRQPALIPLLLVAILAVSLVFPPVQALANSFLGLFRVQQVRVISFDPAAIEKSASAMDQNADRLEAFFDQNFTVTRQGEFLSQVTREEAAAAAGFNPRLPQNIEIASIGVEPAQTADLTIDSALMNSLLESLGQKTVSIPARLDGQKIHASIPSAVVVAYGNCPSRAQEPGPDEPRASACSTLIQFASPTIQAPDSFPVVQLAEAALQLMGMSPEQARQFSQSVDWASTLVIPIPTSAGTTVAEVTVDGVTGTLVSGEPDGMYTLIWVKNGTVYALNASGDPNLGLLQANSLK